MSADQLESLPSEMRLLRCTVEVTLLEAAVFHVSFEAPDGDEHTVRKGPGKGVDPIRPRSSSWEWSSSCGMIRAVEGGKARTSGGQTLTKHDFASMDDDALSDHFIARLEREGPRATFSWLMGVLDAQSPDLRSSCVRLLPYTGMVEGLDWLETRVGSPVTESWGVAAALLGVSWPRITTWLAEPTPGQLMALDALLAYRAPAPNMAPWHQIAAPVLPNAPPAADLEATLNRVLETRSTPRVKQSIAAIRDYAPEILRDTPRGVAVQDLPKLCLNTDAFSGAPEVIEGHQRVLSGVRRSLKALVSRVKAR